MNILLHPIGIIHSPFTQLEKMPIQPAGRLSARGSLEIEDQYVDALKDLDGFSHIYVIYYFHKSTNWNARVRPFLDKEEHGVFATRAPNRPNPVGLSVFRLVSHESNIINVDNVDVLNGTPLIDIKPYVPQFDRVENVRIGWLSSQIDDVDQTLSDNRFISS